MLRIPDKCHVLHRHYVLILVVAAVATLIGGHFTLRLTLQSDLAELLPDSFDSVKALNRMKEELGSVGQLRIVVETSDFAAARQFIEDLEPQLLTSPSIRYVDYKNDVPFYERNALLFLDTSTIDSLYDAVQNTIDAAKQQLNPLFVDDLFGDEPDRGGDTDALAEWEDRYRSQLPKPFYTNADSTVLVIKVFPSGSNSDLGFIRAMFEEVRDIVDAAGPENYDPGMTIYYGGNFKNRLDEFEVLKSDVFGTAVYGLIGVFLLIALYFRRLVGAVLITVSLLLSLTWTFGLTYLVIGQLNTITAFLFVILFGLGIDYGIHAFARYVESRQSGSSIETAIAHVVCSTGSALATTAITTSAAFFSLMVMDFRGFSDLGFIAGVGMLFALVAMIMVLPALIIAAEKVGLLRIEVIAGDHLTLKRQAFRYSRPILLIATLLTIIAVSLFTRVDFEYDFTNLRAITPERQIVSEKTKGVFTLSESPAVIMANSREEVEEIVAAVRRTMRDDTLSPTIETVRSVFSLVPDDQDARLERIRLIRDLVDSEVEGVVEGNDKRRLDDLRGFLQVDEPFTWKDFPEKDKRQFINKQGQIGNFVFVYPSVALRDGRNAIDFRDDVGKITTASGDEFYAASSNIISAEMLVIMIREGKIAVVLAAVVVFLVVMVDVRSIKAALMMLSPLVIGILWMGALMYVVGMKLNLFNIVVIPSIIGIGVDNGVHIYHRYLEEGPDSLYFVLRHTGLAITMTTLTTIVGYSGLILASHPGLASIGSLAVIGLSATFLAAVVVLPALLHVFAKNA